MLTLFQWLSLQMDMSIKRLKMLRRLRGGLMRGRSSLALRLLLPQGRREILLRVREEDDICIV